MKSNNFNELYDSWLKSKKEIDFAKLYKAILPYLNGYIKKHFSELEQEIRDDVMYLTLSKIYTLFPESYDPTQSSLGTFTCQCAYYDLLQHKKLKKTQKTSNFSHLQQKESYAIEEMIAEEESDNLQEIYSEDLVDAAYLAIENLDTKYSEPLKLYNSGVKYEDIATRLNVNLNTVRSRIHVARKAIKKAISNNLSEEQQEFFTPYKMPLGSTAAGREFRKQFNELKIHSIEDIK